VGEHADRIREGFEAFNKRDFEVLRSLAAPDVEWTPPAELPGSRTYHGPDGVREAMEDLIDIFPELQAEAVRIDEEGSRVVALYRWHGTIPPGASSDPFDVRAGGIFDLDDNGMITRGRFWANWEDTEAAAEKERPTRPAARPGT
jgi:ketosteroid isomerase-like protein